MRLASTHLMLVLSISVSMWALALAGCNNDSEEAERLRIERAAEQAKQKKPKLPPSLYDAEGQLLESAEVNAGLKLPVGMKKFRELHRETIYRSKVPTRKLLEYFGRRLTTGLVDASRGGATYRNAKVRGQESDFVRMDVSILPIGKQGNRISIKLLPVQKKGRRPTPKPVKRAAPTKYKPPIAPTPAQIQEAMRHIAP